MPEAKKSPSGRLQPHILGTGSYLPERIVHNSELEEMVDTTDHWIVTRTGMRERRIARDDEATSDMGAAAARRAIEDAGISANDIDLILVATSTPDMLFPNTANFVQKQIGAARATCLDLEAACSGFLFAMDVASQFIKTGSKNRVLVIGSEKMSSVVDYEDRGTCVLFGDAAGAAVMGPGSGRGVIHTVTGSDGELSDLLMIPAGGSRIPASADSVAQRLHYIKMSGQEVFKNAVANMAQCAQQVLDESGINIRQIKYIIPHQANARIIKAVGQRLKAIDEQVYVNVDKYGNTSSASVIVAMDEASRGGLLMEGDLIMIVVFGAGFTWGASVIEWGR
jgi:3-oxoacyl-[acyl-carrier-protein] synthase-3